MLEKEKEKKKREEKERIEKEKEELKLKENESFSPKPKHSKSFKPSFNFSNIKSPIKKSQFQKYYGSPDILKQAKKSLKNGK